MKKLFNINLNIVLLLLLLLLAAPLSAQDSGWWTYWHRTFKGVILGANPGYEFFIDADNKYVKDAAGKFILIRKVPLVASTYQLYRTIDWKYYAISNRKYYLVRKQL